MGTFDSKHPGLVEPTNDDDVVELGDIEFEPVPPAAGSGEHGGASSDKLRKLLAKSRAVATGEDDYDDFEGKTDMVTGDALAGAMPNLAGPQRPRSPMPSGPPPNASRASGPIPGVDSSQVAPRFPVPPSDSYSGPVPAPPIPNASGPIPVPHPMPSGPAFMPQAPIPLSPTGEFGILPDIGQSRDDYTAYEAPSAGRRRTIAVGATVVVGIVAFLVISKLVIDQWIAPGRAVVWMTAGTTLPTLLCGLLLAWPNSEGRASLRDVLVALVPSLALSGGAIFVATMWTQPAIRTMAVDFVSDSPAVMGAILDDDSIDVAVAGCKHFAPMHEQTDYRAALFSTLTLRPTIATKCMAELSEDAQLALATSLADRWTRELTIEDSEADPERLCATATGLGALPLERASVGARLLQCTLTSPSQRAQECCGQSLSAMAVDAKQFALHLRASMDYVKDEETAARVFGIAFHQKNFSEAQKKFAKDVNFGGPQAQKAALEFACGSAEGGNIEVIQHMRASLEGQCAIDPSGVPTTISAWREICDMTIAELDADRTLPAAATLCSTTQNISVAAATESAQRIIALAGGKDLEGTFARQIDLGYVKVLQEMGRDGEVPDFVSAEDRQRAEAGEFQAETKNKNYMYASPTDDEFQAFQKAYQANESWREAKKRLRKKDDGKED